MKVSMHFSELPIGSWFVFPYQLRRLIEDNIPLEARTIDIAQKITGGTFRRLSGTYRLEVSIAQTFEEGGDPDVIQVEIPSALKELVTL